MAELVYPELAPFAGANVMIGHLSPATARPTATSGCWRATLGEWELAPRSLRARARAEPADGGARGSPTPSTSTRGCCSRGGVGRRGRGALLGEAAEIAASRRSGALIGAHRGARRRRRPAPRLPDELSAREVQILRLVARGLSNREIGAELFISEHTAANHIRSILRKTGCANRTEAASYAHDIALSTA